MMMSEMDARKKNGRSLLMMHGHFSAFNQANQINDTLGMEKYDTQQVKELSDK